MAETPGFLQVETQKQRLRFRKTNLSSEKEVKGLGVLECNRKGD